jgi:hypothetical protein
MPRIAFHSLIVILLLTGLSTAQKFSPGLKLGFDLASSYRNEEIDRSILGGLTGGFFLRFNFSEYFGIQPEVLYAQKGVDYEYQIFDFREIRLHYLEIPVQCIVSIPSSVLMTPYLSFGPYAGVLIEAKENWVTDKVVTSEYSRTDFGISAGFGSAFDVSTGDIIVDFRFNVGLVDVLDNGEMKNWSFALTLGYAFKAPILVGNRTERVQKADASYLRFIGNIKDVNIEVDGGPRFEAKSIDTKYETRPGKHEVKAYRGDQLILHRVLYVGNHETKEVDIP